MFSSFHFAVSELQRRRRSPMTDFLNTSSGAVFYLNLQNVTMSAAHHPNDVRSILSAIETEVGKLLHRGDIPHSAHLALRRISQLNTSAQHAIHDTLPGMEALTVKRVLRPTEAMCCEFAISIGLEVRDGSYFFMTKEGSRWKNVHNWKSVMHAWKHQGYFPSQKVVNNLGRQVPRQPSIVQRDMAKVIAEVSRG